MLNAERLEFDERKVVALSKKKYFKDRMCVSITSNISRPMVSIFDTAAGPDLVHTSSFTRMVRRPPPYPEHVFQVRIEDLCQHHRQSVAFVQLGDLPVQVYFGVVDSLALPLLTGTSFINRTFKAIIAIEWCPSILAQSQLLQNTWPCQPTGCIAKQIRRGDHY